MSYADAIQEFRRVIEDYGLLPGEVIADGQLHRCPTKDKPSKRNGAYMLHPDEPISGWYLDWASGNEGTTWTYKSTERLTRKEKDELRLRRKREQEAREKERSERYAEAAAKAKRTLDKAPDCTEHPYLKRKGVPVLGDLHLGASGELVIPVLGPDGEVQSVQRVFSDGSKRFLTRSKVAGGYFPIEGNDGPLHIAEGYATAATVHQATGAPVFVAFDSGNLEAVARMAREKYPTREIILAADNDRETEAKGKGNPGRTAATAAARAIGGKVALPVFPEGATGTDFNDLAAVAGLEEVRRQLAEAREPAPLPAKVELPPGYVIRNDGVYFEVEDRDGNPRSHFVCSPLCVTAETRSAEGTEWGRLLEIEDPDGGTHRWAMPMEMTAGDGVVYREELLSLGLVIGTDSKSKSRLHEYITRTKPQAKALCVSRVGWHGQQFVLPDKTYGPAGGEETVLQQPTAENNFKEKGSPADWQDHVGRLCVGNSRLVFAVSAALAGALLYPLECESGGFHYIGGSSIGKTTALQVAGSVCGGGGVRGYVNSWRTTDNGLEGVAAGHCDTVLCLDEMSEVEGKAAGNIAYMLANGRGKTRADKSGASRTAQEWRLVFLSTGEITLADKVREDGRRKSTAGQAVRVVDIPADAGAGLGLFENLHGHMDGDAFARVLREAVGKCYGAPLRAYLEYLTANIEQATTRAKAIMKQFTAARCPADADGQVKRASARFALVAAAGEAGIDAGVLPWPIGEASDAAGRCFAAWLNERGGIGAAESQEGIERVRAFIQQNPARFKDDKHESDYPPIHNQAGYVVKDTYCIFPKVFMDEVCQGMSHRLVCKALAENGFLHREIDRHQKKVWIYCERRIISFFVIDCAILGDPCYNCAPKEDD